jgi:hypothetical protein
MGEGEGEEELKKKSGRERGRRSESKTEKKIGRGRGRTAKIYLFIYCPLLLHVNMFFFIFNFSIYRWTSEPTKTLIISQPSIKYKFNHNQLNFCYIILALEFNVLNVLFSLMLLILYCNKFLQSVKYSFLFHSQVLLNLYVSHLRYSSFRRIKLREYIC